MFKCYREAYRKDRNLRNCLWFYKYEKKWYGRRDNCEKDVKEATEQLIIYQKQRKQMKLLYRKLGHKGYEQHKKKLQDDQQKESNKEVKILSEEQQNINKIVEQKQQLNTPLQIVQDEVTNIQYKSFYKQLTVSAYNNKELVIQKDRDESVQTQQMESQKKIVKKFPNKICPGAQLNIQPANKKQEKIRTSYQKSQRLLKLVNQI
eukprot:403362916